MCPTYFSFFVFVNVVYQYQGGFEWMGFFFPGGLHVCIFWLRMHHGVGGGDSNKKDKKHGIDFGIKVEYIFFSFL